VQRAPAPPPAAPAPTAAPGAASGTGLDIGAVHGAWGDILEAVKQRSKVAWIMLEGTQPASVEHNVLTVAFAEEGKRKGFSVGGKEVVFREVLKEYLGVDWRIETLLADPRTVRPGAGSARPVASAPAPAGRPSAAPPARRERPAEPPPPPPPDEPPPMDESDEVDPDGDADAGADAEVNGMALIQRELGGQIIREIDNT
jgi:DNA polymerase III subunit gamma/tau